MKNLNLFNVGLRANLSMTSKSFAKKLTLLGVLFMLLPNLSGANLNKHNYFIDPEVKDISHEYMGNIKSNVFHLFSHGRSGELLLDGQWRNANEITHFLAPMLEGKSHLNIYGCEFAKGEKGKATVSYLETTLGVSIAASTNITGTDGDWDLEIGSTTTAISLPNYQYNLQTCAGTVGGTDPEDDRDGDGYCNDVDLDDDNDGILDTDEGYTTVLGAGILIQCDNGDIKKFNHTTNVWDVVCPTVAYSGDFAVNTKGEIYVCDYVSGSVTIYKVNSDCSTIQVATTTATSFGSGLAFLPDGRIVLGTNLNGVIYQVDVSSGIISPYGNIGGGDYINGDLIVQNDTLYYSAVHRTPAPTVVNLWSQPLNSSYNPTGSATLRGPVSLDGLGFSVDANGNILGLTGTNVLENISKTTGATGLSTVPSYGCYAYGASSVFDAGTGCLQDTDGDGICDYLDSDSDNDGCPDVVEAGHTDPDGDGIVGTGTPSVDGFGRVTGITYPSTVPAAVTDLNQNTACCDAAVSGFPDNDGDNIADACDLDDDNDGILDTEEGGCNSTSLDLSNGTVNVTLSTWSFSTNTNYVELQGGDPSPNYPEVFINAFDAVGGAGYFEYTFPQPITLTVDASGQLDYSFDYYDNLGGFTGNYITSNLPFNLNTTTGTLTGSYNISGDIAILDAGGWVNKTVSYTTTPNSVVTVTGFSGQLEGNTSGFGSTFNSLSTEVYAIAPGELVGCSADRDIDGDGIPDYLDLDSDNDGCSDAYEAGSVSSNGDTIAGPYGNNGLANSIEDKDSLNAITTYASTYDPVALDSNNRKCINILPIIDANSIFKDSTATGNILTNDYSDNPIKVTALDGAVITPTGSMVTTANGGTLTMDSTGSYTYVPALGFVGKDTITYTVCTIEAPIVCADELLIINVEEIGDPTDPNANSIIGNPDEMVTYGDPVMINLLTNDRDPEGDTKDFKGVIDPATGNPVNSGTISNIPGVDADGNPVANAGSLIVNADGTVEFVPAPGFKGTANTLTYEVCDDGTPIVCTVEDIKITVYDEAGSAAAMRDNPPYANDDFAATDIDAPVDGNFIGNDGDPDASDAIQVNGVIIDPSGPVTAIQTLTTNNGGTVVLKSDGSYTYTPPAGFSGTDNVVYEICDTSVDVQCTKATMTFLISTVVRDYQDFPTSLYPEVYTRFLDGANNTNAGLNPFWLGSYVSDEGAASTNTTASADNFDDGFIYPTVLDSTNPINNKHQIVVNSSISGVKVYYRLSIDWNDDGTFDDFYSGSGVTNSPDSIDVFVSTPPNFRGSLVNYRVVVQTDSSRLSSTVLKGGEIEDYQAFIAMPLPVSLLSFEAELVEGNAFLTWSTATEVNNDRFEVLRMIEGESEFVKVGEVKGAGNSNQVMPYNFLDNLTDVKAGRVFYKLRQIDFNGEYEDSDIRNVILNKELQKDVLIYPNPTNGSLRINLANADGVFVYYLYNNFGQLIKTGETVNDAEVDISNIPVGIYTIIINRGNGYVRSSILIE